MDNFRLDDLRALSNSDLEALKRKADGGDHTAQYQYGMALLYGQTDNGGAKQAAGYLTKAAESGEKMPLAALSMILDHGLCGEFNHSRSIAVMSQLYDTVCKTKIAVNPLVKGETALNKLSVEYPQVRKLITEMIGIAGMVAFKDGKFCFPWTGTTFDKLLKGLEKAAPEVAKMQELLKEGAKGSGNQDGQAMFYVEDMLLMPLEVLKALAGRQIGRKLLKERDFSVLEPNEQTNQFLGRLLIDDDDQKDNDYIIGGLRRMAGHDGEPLWQMRTALWYEYDKDTRELGEAEYWYKQASEKLEPAAKALKRVTERLEYKMERDKTVGSDADAMMVYLSYSHNSEMANTWNIEGALRGKEGALSKLAMPHKSSADSILGSKIVAEQPFFEYLAREKSSAAKAAAGWAKKMKEEVDGWAEMVRKRKADAKNAAECQELVKQIEEKKREIAAFAEKWEKNGIEGKRDSLKESIKNRLKELKTPAKGGTKQPFWKMFFFADEAQTDRIEQLKADEKEVKETVKSIDSYLSSFSSEKEEVGKTKCSANELDKKKLQQTLKKLDDRFTTMKDATIQTEKYLKNLEEKSSELNGRGASVSKKFSILRSAISVLVLVALLKFGVGFISDSFGGSSADDEPQTERSMGLVGSNDDSSDDVPSDDDPEADDEFAAVQDEVDAEIAKAQAEIDAEVAKAQAEMEAAMSGSTGNSEKDVKERLKKMFDYVYSFDSNGLAKIEKGDKKGYANRKGQVVLPPKYDYIYSFDSDGWAKVELNDKKGFIVLKGGKITEIVKPKYDYIYSFDSDGWAKVELNDKKGFIDRSGREVVPPVYDYIYSFSGGKAKVEKGNKTGYINRQGKLVQPLQ